MIYHRQHTVFFAFAVAKVVVIAWLAVHGFPRSTGDFLVFKQAAAEYELTGRFVAPSLVYLPGADEVYGAYPPGYAYVNVVVFRLFGVSYHATLIADLAVHLLLSTIIAAILFAQTRNGLIAGVCLLGSTGFMMPLGRPEELAAVFTVCTFLGLKAGWPRPSVWCLIALTGLTAPSQGVTSMLLYMGFEAVRDDISFRLLLRMLCEGVAVSAILLLIWMPVWSTNPSLVLQQFVRHAGYGFSHQVGSLSDRPEFLLAATAILCAGFGVYLSVIVSCCGFCRPAIREKCFLSTVICGLVIATTVSMVLRRYLYDYRLVMHVGLAVTVYSGHILRRKINTGGRSRLLVLTRNIVTVATLGIVLLANRHIVRYVVVPFSWNSSAKTSYVDAEEIIDRHVPRGASIAGDAILYWAVAKRPKARFTVARSLTADELPDYLVAAPFWHQKGIVFTSFSENELARFQREYMEVTPFEQGSEACLRLPLGMVVPLSRSSRCDWGVRVFKRRK